MVPVKAELEQSEEVNTDYKIDIKALPNFLSLVN